jgi:hypothetical protein
LFADIMEIFALIAHLVSTCVRVVLHGGVRAVLAESLREPLRNDLCTNLRFKEIVQRVNFN